MGEAGGFSGRGLGEMICLGDSSGLPSGSSAIGVISCDVLSERRPDRVLFPMRILSQCSEISCFHMNHFLASGGGAPSLVALPEIRKFGTVKSWRAFAPRDNRDDRDDILPDCKDSEDR